MSDSASESPDRRDDAAFLQAYLANRDVKCPGCGYNLRGLRESICPECGEALALAVITSSKRISLYTAGLTGLGLSALLAVVYTAAQVMNSLLWAVLGAFVSFWLVGEVLRWRQARSMFASLPRRRRQERAVLCWVPVVVLLVLLLGL